MNVAPTAPGFRPGYYVVDSSGRHDSLRFSIQERAFAVRRAAYLHRCSRLSVYVLERREPRGDATVTFTAGDSRSVATALLDAISG